MRTAWIIIALLAVLQAAHAQPSNELIRQHALLTKECRSIRGHAGRVLAEMGESQFNRSVALAHAREARRSIFAMEEVLEDSKKLLSREQFNRVAGHYVSLEKICAQLKTLGARLEQELSDENFDRSTVRQLAAALRDEVRKGNAEHSAIKKKLGITDSR